MYQERQKRYLGTLSAIGNVLSIEEKFDIKDQFNPCNLILPGMPSCEEQQCLWSAWLQKHVDMRFKPLHFTEGKSCLWPMGGQLNPPKSNDIDKVSFIITFQEPIPILYQCILHVFLDSRYAPSAEMILVQDGPSESRRVKKLAEALTLAFGFEIKYIQNEKTLGFGGSNNKGVEAASGNLIAIINSDALLHPGWSRSMMMTMHMYPKVAYIGSQLIGDEEIITDAGGCVWSDSTPEIIGRWLKELPPHLAYMRPVDYCSAAAIMIRKDVFSLLGGFDPAFGKGYFEDTDLAFRVRNLGYHVVIQPMSLAYHQEGSTLGNEDSSTRQVLFERGMQAFRNKWGQETKALHCPSERKDSYSAAHRLRKINILYLDSNLPEIDRDSGSIRQDYMLQLLTSMGAQVHFYPTESHHVKYLQRALFIGVNVLSVDERYEIIFGNGPICKYNAIIVSHRDNYQKYLPQLKSSGCSDKVIFDTVDLHFLREARQYLSRSRRWNFDSKQDIEFVKKLLSSEDEILSVEEAQLKRDIALELELLNEAQISLFASDVEIEVISKLSPHIRAQTVTNIYDMSKKQFGQQPWSSRSGCIFIGNLNHSPNLEAIKALLEDVLPELRKLLNKKSWFRIHIVGSNIIPDEIRTLISKHKNIVHFHHNLDLDQLRQLYDSVLISIAPLQSGAGVKGKIAEAVLMGVPIVGTPIALEAMHLVDGKDVLIASEPIQFAVKMHNLMTNEYLWTSLRERAWYSLSNFFSVKVASSALENALSALIPAEHLNITNPAC